MWTDILEFNNFVSISRGAFKKKKTKEISVNKRRAKWKCNLIMKNLNG
jgi:hypothetical protein